VTGRPEPTEDRPGEEVLEVEHLEVVLGGRPILRDVSFTVRRGEFTGLIGPNGAGKTTLLRAVLGLQAPTSGVIRLVGSPVGRPANPVTPGGSAAPGRRRTDLAVGYVPQKIQFDPDLPLRARDLVGLGLDGHRLGLPWPSRRRRELVDATLEAVDAAGFADRRVGQLSGGEQQRVLIAHALVRRPQLLVLDEPLANLDLRSEQEVVGLLRRIAASEGVAVLMSAHDMNPLLSATDRIIYLANGRAASGTTEEVARSDVLSELYGHHVDVIRLHDQILIAASPHVVPAGPTAPEVVPPEPAPEVAEAAGSGAVGGGCDR
jgi:zinc/manganese transport system ATP-binding protein